MMKETVILKHNYVRSECIEFLAQTEEDGAWVTADIKTCK